MRVRSLVCVLAATLVTACSAGGGMMFNDGGTDSHADADAGPCQQGQFSCLGNQARACNGDGGFTGTTDCASLNLVCAPVVGCRVCVPNSTQCSPTDPGTTQSCASDGSGWSDNTTCDSSMGLACVDGACVNPCSSGGPSYLGCEYWPTVTVNSQLPPGFDFAVVVANPQTFAVSLNITGGSLSTPIIRMLDPGTVQEVHLPWVTALAQEGQDPMTECSGFCIGTSAYQTGGTYHLTTNAPVAAYQFNPIEFESASSVYSYTVDASLLLPTPVLTEHYTVVSHDNWTVTGGGTLGGFVAITATAGGTTNVMVNLTATVSSGPGVMGVGPGMHAYMMQQGDVLQLVGSQPGEDLTGTTVVSDAPIAVFTGHDCTQIPLTLAACDHLEEQLFPNETWGTHYAVSQLQDRGTTEQSVIRIVSERAGLQLTFDGIAAPAACAGMLGATAHCEFQTASSFQVTGTGPFLVMQYMLGQGPPAAMCVPSPPDTPTCEGDPAMATEVAVEQYRTSYDFLTPDTYNRNFVNVTLPSGIVVQLDGVALTGTPQPVGTGYGVLVLPVTPGAHHIATTDSQGFGIKVYGIAPYTAYLFPGGLDLMQIAPPK